MKMNLTTFYAYIRNAPFGGRLTPEQVAGIDQIVRAAVRIRDPRHLAYILATAFHETGARMVPVREGFAKSDASARKIVAKYKYARPDSLTGHVYYGRGHVQLTWADNYKRMGQIVGADLYNHPDLALDPGLSARILVEGMNRGSYTGKALNAYFNDAIDDPVAARAIVNGTDKAHLIAGYYHSFLGAIRSALEPEAPADVKPSDALPDAPNLLKDPATLGAVSAVASSGVFGAFGAIDSPWAFAAFAAVLVAIGVFLWARKRIVWKAGA